MTPLRQRMIDTMQLRGLSPRTQQSYLSAVRHLALYFHKSPDTITEDQLRQYFLFLIADKQLAPNTTNVAYPDSLRKRAPLRPIAAQPSSSER